MSKTRKNTRATRAELRAKVRRQKIEFNKLHRTALNTAAELADANNRLALIKRRADQLESERSRESDMVKRIVELIRSRQPASALLPLDEAPLMNRGDRYLLPPRQGHHYRDVFCPSFDEMRPLAPIVLNDLLMALEYEPVKWDRIAWACVRTEAGTLNACVKFSSELIELYRCNRELFIADVGRMIAKHLWHGLNQPKQPQQ